jgi:hypothetical protein
MVADDPLSWPDFPRKRKRERNAVINYRWVLGGKYYVDIHVARRQIELWISSLTVYEVWCLIRDIHHSSTADQQIISSIWPLLSPTRGRRGPFNFSRLAASRSCPIMPAIVGTLASR